MCTVMNNLLKDSQPESRDEQTCSRLVSHSLEIEMSETFFCMGRQCVMIMVAVHRMQINSSAHTLLLAGSGGQDTHTQTYNK